MVFRFSIILIFIISLYPVSSATIINIPGDWPTIQQGIDAGADGDTVLVQPGTYVENINFNGHNIVLGSLFLTTGDTSYIAQTVIDGDSAGSVVVFVSDEDNTAILIGFTITNGYEYIGGIACAMSNPQIRDNIISGNSGIAAAGISCHTANAIIVGNKIINNISISAEGAGGISCRFCSPIIDNNVIMNNSALAGGGIDCYRSYPLISNNVIVENSAAYGGGITISYCSPILKNNTVCGNSANIYGGGIVIYNSTPTIINTIVWNNSADQDPGIWFDGNSTPIIQFSNIQDTLWPSEGNINIDPLFRDPDNNDFHLMSIACGDSADSPCIDTGDPNILDSLLDCSWGLGGPRSDMGAYGGGDSAIVGIFDNIPPMPSRFMLLQNYPNPFNASTTIRFALPEPQVVLLTVYDLLGRRVQTLLDEYMQAGVHTLTFDASDFPSGVYFARLKTNNATKSIKMLLLK